MIWMILSIIVCAIWFITENRNISMDIKSHIKDGIGGALFGVVIGLLAILIIGGIIGTFLPTKDVPIDTWYIYSVEDNMQTEGSFVLGCGSVDEDLTYYYMVNTNRGYKVKDIPASECYIKIIGSNDDDGITTPQIVEYQGEFINENHYWIGMPSGHSYSVMYVPEDTIKEKYNVDLE